MMSEQMLANSRFSEVLQEAEWLTLLSQHFCIFLGWGGGKKEVYQDDCVICWQTWSQTSPSITGGLDNCRNRHDKLGSEEQSQVVASKGKRTVEILSHCVLVQSHCVGTGQLGLPLPQAHGVGHG
jgi:hypothetical protein